MIPLALLARSDGNSDVAEQNAMFDHARRRAGGKRRDGRRIRSSPRSRAYIAGLTPSLVQLDPALKRLEHEPPQSVANLLDAAKKVIEADGVLDPAEAHLLDEMKHELTKA